MGEGALLFQHDAGAVYCASTFRRCHAPGGTRTSTTGPGTLRLWASHSRRWIRPRASRGLAALVWAELNPDHGLHGGEVPHGQGVRPEGVRPESRQFWGASPLFSSAAVSGAFVAAFDDLDPSLKVTYLTLEFGTRPNS